MAAGSLLTQFFLNDGIRETPRYRTLDPTTLETLRLRLRLLWLDFTTIARPSEAETEDRFIFPTLRELGWDWLVQPRADRSRRDVADALLFLAPAARQAAQALPPTARFRHGTVIVENEARHTRLDRAPASNEAPATQILRYMARAETQSDGLMRWGLLTNGGEWRLYDVRASSRAEGFAALDLAAILDPPPLAPLPLPPGAPPDHWMRVFLLLFGRDAFDPGADTATFVETAIAEGRTYQARITEALSASVFDQVFPRLLDALLTHDPHADATSPAWRTTAREAAIQLLYRLLFLFSAEDRGLLPVAANAYRPYSMRQLREDAAASIDQRQPLSRQATRRWTQLTDLFAAIANGDPALQLPAYNGSLFRDPPDSLLTRARLPDDILIRLIDDVSRTPSPTGRRWINYRDLSVQHLGSIYERLLEQDVVATPLATLAIRPSPYARKGSGSYYTREELVQLILRQTILPLIAERRAAFQADPGADLATAILALRCCDPAMGSGHFLVSLVDLLTDEIITALADAAAPIPAPHPASPHPAPRSPLAATIAETRARIEHNAERHGWATSPAHLANQLDDRHLVRRMVLKRCVFGVDLNPMAVELAKLSLWLHSFTVGAPLSFLDHHLRCGDSLFGEFVAPAVQQLQKEYGLAIPAAVTAAEQAATMMSGIEHHADADLEEVHASAQAFQQLEAATAPLRAFLNLYHAARWLPEDSDVEKAARRALFGGAYGDPVAIMGGAPLRQPPPDAGLVRKPTPKRPAITAHQVHEAALGFLHRARALCAEQRFLHWQAAFPGIWTHWLDPAPQGGFHALVGNPPWDRIKMQEVEWWAARDPAVARLTRAADRKRAITARSKAQDPLAAEYARAAHRAKRAAEVAAFLPTLRKDGTQKPGAYPLYPLFAKGDVNLYALFVERAGQLADPHGIVGLLVPSGVAADKGAATFFASISNTGRLGALLDFENRRTAKGLEPFFPDVDSRFKFSALIHGGTARRYPEARCAFFQHDVRDAEANAFPIAPADFALVNPNTGTAPVFRTRRDAEIVLEIYRRHPVLIDRRSTPPRTLYPVAYATQFHMTNDSHLFRTAAELETEGAYPVTGGRFERGQQTWLPLMAGRSIHLFDHRYASVLETGAEDAEDGTVSQNVNRPFSSGLTTPAQHASPGYTPAPRHWVNTTELDARWPNALQWALAFRDITSPTNARTMIAAIVPQAAFANALPLLLPPTVPEPLPSPLPEYRSTAPLLIANLCSSAFDYIARNKVQSTHLNFYIVEQLPFIAPADFARRFGPHTAEHIIREDVLHLTYTAADLAPFARDQGYAGPPFPWDEEDRLRRRARLDALFMLLYGLDRPTAAHILETFPIVRREEQDRYGGRYRSRDLTLRTTAALEAGNPNARIDA